MRSYDGGYQRFLRRPLFKQPGLGELHRAIGGDFEAFGILERELLKFYGLQASDPLVDVGCGAGRLAAALHGWFTGDYLGTDVVPRLLAAARKVATQPQWAFVRVAGISIPAKSDSTDMVCMFSVVTHLLHEDSYCYLAEARRVLRPGGRIVFSFLEFPNDNHWRHFIRSIEDRRGSKKLPLTMFLSRDAIGVWARNLGLNIVEFRDGTDHFIPLSAPIVLESGAVMNDLGSLGQTCCVLERR